MADLFPPPSKKVYLKTEDYTPLDLANAIIDLIECGYEVILDTAETVKPYIPPYIPNSPAPIFPVISHVGRSSLPDTSGPGTPFYADYDKDYSAWPQDQYDG